MFWCRWSQERDALPPPDLRNPTTHLGSCLRLPGSNMRKMSIAGTSSHRGMWSWPSHSMMSSTRRRCKWHRALTRQLDNHINLALVKEFYANLYDPKDRSPRQCKVWGKVINFDAATLNEFLETSVVLEPRERYSAYSKFCSTYPDP